MRQKGQRFEDKAQRPAADTAPDGAGQSAAQAQALDDQAEGLLMIRLCPGRAVLIDGVRREAGEVVTVPARTAQRLVAAGYADYVRET